MRTISLLILTSLLTPHASGDDSGIEVAEGLTIRQVADDDVLPDCTAITVDAKGRVIASGPGYIRMLIDDEGNGRYQQYTTLVDGPSHGAQGLCVDAGALYYVGDDGVWQVTDTNQDGLVDSSPIRVLEITTGGEHDAHAIRKGPDGFWYLIAGNGTKGMFALQNTEKPSIPHPRAGVIWRIAPDWSRREVWAHGFRNAYDFDFAPQMAIDTFDSDGERDVSLPWYRPTRAFRVRQGDDAGWLTRSWKRPNSDPQMPQLLAELGRGSPTGVLRYRYHRLPTRFHDGLFVLDWTFGRIVFVGDNKHTEVVAQPRGTTGFAVTDIDALPDGRLVVSVGGRRSRGGLYLIDATDRSNETGSNELRWSRQPSLDTTSDCRDWIVKLRNRTEPIIDHEAAAHAVKILQHSDVDSGELIAAMTLLIESVGGLGEGDSKDARGKEQVAAVFDGYRSPIRPKLSSGVIQRATYELISLIHSDRADHELQNEAIRVLAVLEPESSDAFSAIVATLEQTDSPIDKLHRLIALARLPVSRSDEMTEQVVAAMLEIPVRVDELKLQVDRNWTPRLGELFLALQRRDSLLPSRLVSNPEFGHPAHLVWTEQMDPENLERARRLYLTQSRDKSIDPQVARFIALGADAVPRSFISQWLKDPLLRPAAWLAIASHPKASDAAQMQRAAMSVDSTVREAASRALSRLGAEIPEREPTSLAIERWLEKTESIIQLDADAASGKEIFTVRQCAACHDGTKALGPSLQGISKRFDSRDLLRATVDPSHLIPDRYRAKQILTTDDRILTGMAIYESVDGLTLMTADAKMLRINADAIAEIRPSSQSLMPEGLIDGLTDQQVASLLAYIRSL